MPLISRVKENNLYENQEVSGNNFANPNSLLRNQVRLRDGEFVTMSFLGDIDDGEVSLYHDIPQKSANNKDFSEYVYCTVKNLREVGVPMVDRPCQYCMSNEKKLQSLKRRYKYWVLVYYHYHNDQNAYADRDGEDYWEDIGMGRKRYFRQPVMKPQLFDMSRTGYGVLENNVDKLGTLEGFVFDYSRLRADNRVSYLLERSMVDVPDIMDNAMSIVSTLPSLEAVAMGDVAEHEFPVLLQVNSGSGSVSDKDAFDSVAGRV